MPRYRLHLPSAECVHEVHVHTEGNLTISYSTTDGQTASPQSDVTAVPEPSVALSLVAGALLLAMLRGPLQRG